jgi:hypothetical protein
MAKEQEDSSTISKVIYKNSLPDEQLSVYKVAAYINTLDDNKRTLMH